MRAQPASSPSSGLPPAAPGARHVLRHVRRAMLGDSVFTGALRALNALAYLYLLAPIIIVILASFTPRTFISFPPHGWSLRWYHAAVAQREVLTSFSLSLWLAGLAAATATALGLLGAFALVRYRFPGRGFLTVFVLSPLLLPGVVTGVALLQFLSAIGARPSFTRLLLAHVVIVTPYVIRAVTASLVGVNTELEEAAMTLGANRWTVTHLITLPLIRSAVIAGAIFAFIASFDNVAVSIFLSTPEFTPLPILLYQYVEATGTPVVAAVSTLQILLIAGLMLALERFVGLSGHV